ncbi:MAG: hypothetical protein L3J41_06770 [Melioribacteraceae bacterium]|nr:hypothetical protein [Melioribacteraceae bacterium]
MKCTIIVFLFLAIFQPFGLDRIENNTFLYFAGYGLITTLIILVNVFIVMNLFKNFFSVENWTVGKSFFHSSIITIFIAFFNWLYFITFDKTSNLDFSFLYFILLTIAVGIFPSMFSIFFLYRQ